MNDLVSEIDALIKFLDESQIDRARLKLAKLRVGVQNLIDDIAEARVATREAEEKLHAANKRLIETSKALSAFSSEPSANDGKPKRKNGARKRKPKV